MYLLLLLLLDDDDDDDDEKSVLLRQMVFCWERGKVERNERERSSSRSQIAPSTAPKTTKRRISLNKSRTSKEDKEEERTMK